MPRPLVALLACSVVLALAWATAVAPLQGPDEPAHMAYVQYLAETGNKPAFDSGVASLSSELFAARETANLRSATGVAHARPFSSPADERLWRDLEGAGLRKDDGSGPNAVAKNPPLYYALAAAPYLALRDAPFFTRALVLRLASALLFVATVAFTWLLVAELTRRLWVRTCATAAVALHPVLAFMAGVVNPDSLLTALWAAFLLVAVRLQTRGPSAARFAALAAITAAALATHGRGLPLVLPALAAVALSIRAHRPEARRKLKWAAGGVTAAAAGVMALLLARGTAYGGELELRGAGDPAELASFVWQFYLPALPFMDSPRGPDFGAGDLFVEQYFARFGSMEIAFSADTITALKVLALVGLAGLVAALVARRTELRARWEVPAILALTALSLIAFLHLASFRSLTSGSSDPLIVGRYLLPLTPLFGLAVAFTAASAGRRGPLLAALVIALGVALQLGGLGLTLARFHG